MNDCPEQVPWGVVSCHWHLRVCKRSQSCHIVPFFLDVDAIGEIVFGSRALSLRHPGPALLLSTKIKKWFETYQILIVPVDAQQLPRFTTPAAHPGAASETLRGCMRDAYYSSIISKGSPGPLSTWPGRSARQTGTSSCSNAPRSQARGFPVGGG
jgi:hypothetical protein